MSATSSEPDRGIKYADGGADWAPIYYPDPERIRQINLEWENRYVPLDREPPVGRLETDQTDPPLAVKTVTIPRDFSERNITRQ